MGVAGHAIGIETNRPVSFNRDIRPILSDTCFPCHGFDANKRKAGLRLDTFEGATAEIQGRHAIQPENPAGSELWNRITAADPKKIMPPPESAKTLKPDQVALLRQWIEEGARYQKHWAFEPPVRPAAPPVSEVEWPRNDLDRFILAGLEAKHLKPSKPASKQTLIRRVTLDLTGLPPTVAEVDSFLADTATNAYERVVDRLLQSPQYGEQMARVWLDVARYGDTHGLHLDNERSMWPYRDWVVEAFNNNLPYDQFTIWQLAGDLLPDPTREQLVASGYNRCNVSTSEGGAIDEEFQARYAIDRVEATSTAWMGLTMGCAVCHDHKLDPITQKEFYQVFSIFNNIDEKAMDGNALLPPPMLKLPTPEQKKKLSDLDDRIAGLEKELKAKVAQIQYVDPATQTNLPKPETREVVLVEDDFPSKADIKHAGEDERSVWITKAEGPVYSGEKALLRSGKGLNQVFYESGPEALTVNAGDKFFAHVFIDPKSAPKSIMLQFHTDDWNHRANWGDPDAIPYGAKGTAEKTQIGALPEAGKWVRLEFEASAVGLKPGMRITGVAWTQFDGTVYWDKLGRITTLDPANDPSLSLLAWTKSEREAGDKSSAPAEIKELLKKDFGKLEDGERTKLREHFLSAVYSDPQSGIPALRDQLSSTRQAREALDKEIPATMVSKELEKRRPAWVLIRGQYDKHGEEVGPGVPAILPPLPSGAATNRLTFARWLVDSKHPLTARVNVNRYWQQFFGTGIVKTAEDFGSKGEWPSNPELLDWLATEFLRTGWDVKALVKLIVTSSTYCQDSAVRPELRQIDPENRLLGRGPRYRLDAEVLRDEALFVSGLLNPKMGGRGVRPYQPPGIWEAVGYTTSNTAKYEQDKGDALYRRSLYIFWKRTAPPPSMTAFDAPSREQCRARRERTNTPLQALVTMNDPQYFETARQLGYRMLHEGGASEADRIRFGFRLATSRLPMDKETTVLVESLKTQLAHFAGDPENARKAIAVGNSPVPSDVAPADLAAYTMVANLLLNLDEVVTKN